MGHDHVISLFSGAGGMSYGFARAGLKPVFAADIDADACASYRQNLHIDALLTDLGKPDASRTRRLSEFKNPFAIIGGPPCQGFSSAGRKDASDKRNRLIFEYLDLVEALQPRWFLFENVEGLLTSNWGTSLHALTTELISLGYRLRVEKVNFASYGLPQGRKRVVIIGNRLNMDFEFPILRYSFNAGKHKGFNGLPFAPSFDEAVAGLPLAGKTTEYLADYASLSPASSYDAAMREGNAAARVSLHYSTASKGLLNLAGRLEPGQTMKDLDPEHWHESFARRAFRRVMDGTPVEKRGGAPSGVKRLVGHLNALTITSAASREFIHPREGRPLTLRECARLQSFPDGYSFAGNSLSVMRQIGNAFPPLAAEVFARHLIELDGTHGADVVSRKDANGALIGYRLTEAAAMSPALATTDRLLAGLMHTQADLPLEEVA